MTCASERSKREHDSRDDRKGLKTWKSIVPLRAWTVDLSWRGEVGEPAGSFLLRFVCGEEVFLGFAATFPRAPRLGIRAKMNEPRNNKKQVSWLALVSLLEVRETLWKSESKQQDKSCLKMTAPDFAGEDWSEINPSLHSTKLLQLICFTTLQEGN